MKKTLWMKLSLLVVMLLSAVSFTACVDDNEDVGMPFLELDIEELPLTDEGGVATFTVATNRPWTATLAEGSEWISLSKMQGEGTTEVELSVPATTYGRVGEVQFHLSNTYAVYETKTLVVKQGEVEEVELIYSETVGTASVSSPYPYVDAYTSWQTDGTGASTVSYTGKSASVRASGLANAGSGPNVIFFGTLPAYFTVNNITLQPQHQRLALSFLGSFSYKPEGSSEYDNSFNLDNFTVEISGDGQKWTKLACTKDNGDAEHPYWVAVESKFILKEVPEHLSIRFTAAFASAFRLDDIRVETFSGMAPEIDLSAGTEGGENPGGDDPTPTPTPTGALWHENFGDAGEDKPLVADYTAWEKGGSVGANVTYSTLSGKMSVRESGKLSAGYADASAAAKLFFGTDSPAFGVSNIALTAEQTKLRLNFGGAYSKNTNGTYDNTFYADKFHVYLSGDGQQWSEISYTTAQADEYWIYATADFTLTAPAEKLYVKFAADEASVYAIDDVCLTTGEGGQSVTLGEGGENPTPEPDPTPTTDKIFYETFGDPVKDGSYWPYANENATNIMAGTGVVAGTTTYNGYSVTARSVGTYTSPTPPTSGAGHIWFPANKTAAQNFFEVQKLVLNGEKNLDITFYLHGNTEPYKEGDIMLHLSADGTNWVAVNFTTGTIAEAAESTWKVATTSITLKESPEYLYMKFSSETTGGCRLDDPTIAKGNGGTEIDLAGGGSTPTPDPDPEPTPTPTEGEKYLIVANVDGVWRAATPLTSDKSYGYLQPTDVTVAENAVVADATSNALAWTMVAGETAGQYAMLGADGRYYYMTGTYNSFNVSATLGTDGYYWTMAKNSDNSYTLTNVANSKTLQYDKQYNSYGVYSDVRGLYVYLFKLNDAGTAYEAISELPSGGSTPTPDPDPTPTPDPEPTPTPGTGALLWHDDFSQFDGQSADGTTDIATTLTGSIEGFKDTYTGEKVYAAAGKVKLASSSKKGTLTTPALKASGTVDATMTVDLAAWTNADTGATDSTKIKILVNGGGTINGAASVDVTLSGASTTYTYTLSGVSAATTITFQSATASKQRFYLDNLKIQQQ